jgi:hypothetical protein
VSFHTTRSVHPHQRALPKTTDVSDGTALEHGSIFTYSPVLWNPPKRYLVENVQKNYLSVLSAPAKSGNARNGLPAGSAAFIPVASALSFIHILQTKMRSQVNALKQRLDTKPTFPQGFPTERTLALAGQIAAHLCHGFPGSSCGHQRGSLISLCCHNGE